MDELDATIYESCSNRASSTSYQSVNNLPMSDYLHTLHDKLDPTDDCATYSRTGTINRFESESVHMKLMLYCEFGQFANWS